MLDQVLQYAIEAHAAHSKAPYKSVRKWDQQTPYWMHPTWCAMTILTESTLSYETRQQGALALLLHDVLEDTTQPVPTHLVGPDVEALVNDLTSFVEFAEKKRNLWTKTPLVRLLKLYDQTSNLLDGAWMPVEKRRAIAEFVAQLADDAEQNFGPLNIIRIARTTLASVQK